MTQKMTENELIETIRQILAAIDLLHTRIDEIEEHLGMNQ